MTQGVGVTFTGRGRDARHADFVWELQWRVQVGTLMPRRLADSQVETSQTRVPGVSCTLPLGWVESPGTVLTWQPVSWAGYRGRLGKQSGG